MVDYLPRSAWGARAAKSGPGLLTVDRVKGAVIHWPGTTSHTPITSQASVASQLRGWQAYHMDDKGWSDIAYQVAVDQAGRAWTLRGLRTQSGANGGTEQNEDYCAILLVLVQGEQPSAAMKATVREVIADVRRIYPNGTLIRPHSAVRPEPTDCPGPAARAAITRGDFTPNTPEDDMSAADVKAITDHIDAKFAIFNTEGTEGKRYSALQDAINKANRSLTDLAAVVAALQSDVDQTQAAVGGIWGTQIADVYTPESGDTSAAATLLTYGPLRAGDEALGKIQPHLDEIRGTLAAVQDAVAALTPPEPPAPLA